MVNKNNQIIGPKQVISNPTLTSAIIKTLSISFKDNIFYNPTNHSYKDVFNEIGQRSVYRFQEDPKEVLMTAWYMGQIGCSLYDNRLLPKGWEGFTPEEAGFNAVKQALYYALLRKMDSFTENVATKLYNVYCFGYAIEINGKKMIWPEDLDNHKLI